MQPRKANEKDKDGKGKGDAKDGSSPPPPGKGTVVHWKDFVLSEHNEWNEKKDGQQAGNIGIDWTDYTRGHISLMPQHLINVIDCRGNAHQPRSEGDGMWGFSATPESFLPDNTQAAMFGAQIRRYLQSQQRTKVKVEQYSGRIDQRGLIKVLLPPIDGGEWNKRMFYDMEHTKGLDTAIHVLTDWSGSMDGEKMVYAADASGRLVQVFDRILRMPVQLAAFTNGRTRCDIGLIKAFGDKSKSPLDIATSFSKFYKFSSANNDADAIMWAYNQLIKRREKRKLLIVLSDGCPAGSWQGSGSSNLSHVTDMIQQEGRIELYGVGICSNAVATYYKHYKVLESPADINQTLFEVIKGGVK